MGRNYMKAITQDWLNYAEIDLKTCEKLINDEFLTNSVAFHVQQTIEKCFKAIFEENNLKVPRIHNLMRLYDKTTQFIDFTVDENMLEKTDEIYTETRYPGDIGMLPEGKPSIEEVKKLYDFANKIFQKTVTQLSVL